MPKEPLNLWGCEGSLSVKLAREVQRPAFCLSGHGPNAGTSAAQIGARYYKAHMPKEPFTLWGYKASPIVNLAPQNAFHAMFLLCKQTRCLSSSTSPLCGLSCL